jgi:hypothetical protein
VCVVGLAGSFTSLHFVGGEAFEGDRVHKPLPGVRVTLQDSSGRH